MVFLCIFLQVVAYLDSCNSALVNQYNWQFVFADSKLEQNQVAAFLTLLRHLLQTKPVNQDTFIRTQGAATIGALLQKVSHVS